MAFNSIITDSTPWSHYSAQENANATEIYSVLYHNYGWTLEAVCGALGNMTQESFLNPGQYELGHGTPTNPWGYGYGVGLIQLTRPNSNYPNPWLYWCQQNNISIGDGYAQLDLYNHCDESAYQTMGLAQGIWGWISGSAPLYPMSFDDYIISTDTPANLCAVFYQNLENHGGSTDSSLPTRQSYANHWYEYFTGVTPPPPTPSGSSKKMPLWFYLKQPYRRI